jgi:conjugative transfer region lipoprotein (TIGR03751 family)
MSGNVVPDSGPTMENVYDSMLTKNHSSKDFYNHRLSNIISYNNNFSKLPNPELRMFVYYHLAGKEELPIPGYFTVFNAYERDHFALPNETIGI